MYKFENVYNKHEKLDPNRELFYSNGFHEILREGGTNTILSLAFDPIYNPDEKGGLLRKDEYAQVIDFIAVRGSQMATFVDGNTIKLTGVKKPVLPSELIGVFDTDNWFRIYINGSFISSGNYINGVFTSNY
mgnify:CR=1 FL=1